MTIEPFTEAELSEDQAPIADSPPCRVSYGDQWLLGEHVLYCGNSEVRAVTYLAGTEKAKLVFTDPPYDLERPGSGKSKHLGVFTTWTELDEEDIASFVPTKFLDTLPHWFEEGYHCSFIFGSDNLIFKYANWAEVNGLRRYLMTWEKAEHPSPIGNSHWKDFETVIRLHKGVDWNGGQAEPNLWRGRSLSTKRIRRVEGSHPTRKPVEWIIPQILMTTKEGDIVADPYAGEGSTLMACERTQRRCIAIEREPKWCANILAWWESETGLDAQLLSTGHDIRPIPAAAPKPEKSHEVHLRLV